MYEWRKLTPPQRIECLIKRKALKHPWHSPPHEDRGKGAYHLSAACYEHAPFIGATEEEALANLREALELHFEPPVASRQRPNIHKCEENAACDCFGSHSA